MTKTENYQLNQWDLEDRVVHTDFNEDNAKLDAALKAQADALKSENAAWGNAVAVEAQARQALATQVTKCGNCKIIAGTYMGSGKYGETNPSTLTFPQKPVLVFVQPVISTYGRARLALFRDCSYALGCLDYGGSIATAAWSGNSVSWYSNNLDNQCSKAVEYMYVAFLALDED